MSTAGVASADADFEFQRIGGDDRYDTSAMVAEEFRDGDQPDAILANGERYVDALAANFLAGSQDAPVLLTLQDETPQSVLDQLEAMNAESITLMGGEGPISAEQEQSLTDAGYTVERVAGDDRFGTNSEAINTGGNAQDNLGLIATGFDFPDALAGGPISYAGHPLGLASEDDIDDGVVTALKDAGVERVQILGGEAVVGQEVEDELENKGITVAGRLAGDERSGTSVEVANYAVDELGFSDQGVNVASGYPQGMGADALAGGPLTGKQQRPLLVTADVDQPGDRVLDYLEGNACALSNGIIFGGTGAISDGAEQDMQEAARNCATNQGFNVTPETDQTMSGSNGDNQDVTFSDIDADQVNLALINCDQISTENGNVSFTDEDDNDVADLEHTDGNGSIESINGTTQSNPAYGDTQEDVNVQDDGTVDVTVTREQSGCQRLVAYVDSNNDDALNLNGDDTPSEPFAVSGQVKSVNPNGIDATPENNTNPYGQEHTVTGQLTGDSGDSSAQGVAVKVTRFEAGYTTEGPEGNAVESCTSPSTEVESVEKTTDENGQVTYTFNAEDPSTDSGDSIQYCIRVQADTNGDGTFGNDGAAAQDQVGKTYVDDEATPSNTAIELQGNDQKRPGEQSTAVYTVTDQFGNPVSGEEVQFKLTQPGGTTQTSTETTGDNGQASFSFTGNEAGTYTVEGSVDNDDSGDFGDKKKSTSVEYLANGVEEKDSGELSPNVEAALRPGGDEIVAEENDTLQVFGDAETDGFTVENAPSVTIDGTESDAVDGITVASSGTTIQNFTVDFSELAGVTVVDGVSNAAIRGNDISESEDNSAVDSEGVNVEAGSEDVTDVVIEGNMIHDLTATTTDNSPEGVLVSSTGDGSVDGLSITGNEFDDIEGPAGAFGVGVNTLTEGLVIEGNSFNLIAGQGYTVGVGLDGDTPQAEVRANDFMALDTGGDDFAISVNNRDGDSSEGTDGNDFAETIVVQYNNFLDGVSTGVVYDTTDGDDRGSADPKLDATENWWGDPQGPENGSGAGVETENTVEFSPWLCQQYEGGENPETSQNGSCETGNN